MSTRCRAHRLFFAILSTVSMLCLTAPTSGEPTIEWSRSFAADGDARLDLKTLAWDDTAGELLILLRESQSRNPDTGDYPTRQALWRIDADGKRVGERVIPKAIRMHSLEGLVVGSSALILVSHIENRIELVAIGRDGALKSRRDLGPESRAFDPAGPPLQLADGTVVIVGWGRHAAVMIVRPDATVPKVVDFPAKGLSGVIQVAPTRDGHILALLHAEKEVDIEADMGAMFVFAQGAFQVVKLSLDGEVVHRRRLEGRLGSILDTGKGYDLLLDLGPARDQDWWLIHYDEALEETDRVPIRKTIPSLFPNFARLARWPEKGLSAALPGNRGQPWLARLSPRGEVLSSIEIPRSEDDPNIANFHTLRGAGALYLVSQTYELRASGDREILLVTKLVETNTVEADPHTESREKPEVR